MTKGLIKGFSPLEVSTNSVINLCAKNVLKHVDLESKLDKAQTGGENTSSCNKPEKDCHQLAKKISSSEKT